MQCTDKGVEGDIYSCTRRKLVDILFSSKFKNIDRKLEDVDSFLTEKTNCTKSHASDLKVALRNFKHQFKSKWEKCHRMRSDFLIKESTWLNDTIHFKKYLSSAGRPARSFDSSSDQTKRKRTTELRKKASTNELLFASQMSLRASDQRDAADIVRKVSACPDYAAKIQEQLKRPKEEPEKLSALEALAMLVEAKLSREQYNIIRRYAKDIFPSYKELQREKRNCYPTGMQVTENTAVVPVQNLLDHTVQKIITAQKDTLDLVDNELVLTSKWGFDGSSGHSQYHQKFVAEHESDDKFVFITCLVPLQLSDNAHVYWKNPVPSSPRYCRPLKIVFEKESDALVTTEKQLVERQLQNLSNSTVSIGNKEYIVKHQLIFSMIDGKLCNTLSKTTSALRCYLCGATAKQFNDIDTVAGLPFIEDNLSFGMSVLHAWIRLFECLLHVSYKLPVKQWRLNQSTEDIVRRKQMSIQEAFKDKMGLIVDRPKPGYGNTNTGNVARRFFQQSDMAAEITGVSQNLIHRFHVILQCISSGFPINTERFKSYCEQTARLFVNLYPWFYMSTTVHKILIHGHEIISHCLLPIGQLSEEALEARNRDFKVYREFYSRKTSQKDTLTDIFNRMLVSSDPLISSLKAGSTHAYKKVFHPDAIAMFEEPNIPDTE